MIINVIVIIIIIIITPASSACMANTPHDHHRPRDQQRERKMTCACVWKRKSAYSAFFSPEKVKVLRSKCQSITWSTAWPHSTKNSTIDRLRMKERRARWIKRKPTPKRTPDLQRLTLTPNISLISFNPPIIQIVVCLSTCLIWFIPQSHLRWWEWRRGSPSSSVRIFVALFLFTWMDDDVHFLFSWTNIEVLKKKKKKGKHFMTAWYGATRSKGVTAIDPNLDYFPLATHPEVFIPFTP